MSDRAGNANRTNQCNPNHAPTGPGHQAGYHGSGTTSDRNNHSRQCNPQDIKYGKK
ncbi:GSCOCG00008440001-RA-CDS [Cotesia congregata]|nr:GSCOCG00008440001-RA-CDS [Cotesia congregata]